MAIDFYGPTLKVERAEKHIRELEAIFDGYVATHKEVITAKPDNDTREIMFGYRFPNLTPTIVGDAIHNLRAALDHAYCILIEANGQRVDDSAMFPFVKHGKELEGRIRGRKEPNPVPSEPVIKTIIDSIQPYEGGCTGLYGLHLLDRTDKHRVLIPGLLKTKLAGCTIRIVYPNGKRFEWTGGTFLTALSNPFSPAVFGLNPAGGRFEFDGDINSAFEICFGEGQPFENEGIIGKLRELKAAVLKALNKLERAAA